jgi:uncharacterized zinc-type alcohol dehydrogenase-like protein
MEWLALLMFATVIGVLLAGYPVALTLGGVALIFAGIGAATGTFDLIVSTVNVGLDWDAYIGALAPKGRLHLVGATLEPIPLGAMSLIMGQKSISGSPVGSPANVLKMLEFCARHGIAPVTEVFPMSEVDAALAHLAAGKARYRVVLENDF